MNFKYKRALAVIPARGGSKRIPRKNLRMLYDRPLVCHTLDAAVASGCFDTIILSSDDDEILKLADSETAVTALKREARYSGDHATVFSYLHHLVNDAEFSGQYDAIALLLPTAPFRSVETIRKVAEGLELDIDSVITVSAYEFPVQFAVKICADNDLIEPLFDPSPLTSGNTRSQNHSPVYHPNGAMYFAWWKSYAQTGSFYIGQTRASVMTVNESIDIDSEEDFIYADYLMRNRQNKQ